MSKNPRNLKNTRVLLPIAAAFLVVIAGTLVWSALSRSRDRQPEGDATAQPVATRQGPGDSQQIPDQEGEADSEKVGTGIASARLVGIGAPTIGHQEPGRPEVATDDDGPEPDIDPGVDEGPEEEQPTDQMADEKSIPTGFFFNAGEYVAPPYKITVDQDGVKINAICVREVPRHPKGTPIPKVDPGPFQWTAELEAKGMHKSGFVKHAIDRFRYWESQHGFDEAGERFEEYLKQQPLVASVAKGGIGDFGIRYQTKDGDDDGFGFSWPRPKRTEDGIRPENYYLQQGAENLRQTLAGGGAFFVGRGRIYMPSSRVIEFLPQIYEILTSKEPAEHKVASLVERGLLPRSDAQTLVDGFTDDRSLRKRIEELEGKRLR